MEKLKILLPKGRIYDNVVNLFSGAGITIKLPDRAYRPTVNQEDLEAKVMKPQNIGKLLEEIYDIDRPFERTEDEKVCQWCDFKAICGR